MKAKYLGLIFLALLIIFGTISCGTPGGPTEEPEPLSQPQTAQPQQPTGSGSTQPDQASLNNLNTASQRAENARKIVMDFNGSSFFPSEWASAENIYNRAQGLGRATASAVSEAIPLYNSAAVAYEALAEKTIPAYKQDLEDKIIAARNGAISEGARSLAPDYLQKTDSIAIEALDQYEAKDYYTARDTGLLMLDSYNAMVVGLQAYKLRLDIEELGLYQYDSANLDAVDAIGLSALDDFEKGDIASAVNKANDVLARYEQSFAGSIQAAATEMGALATMERARAIAARANVAVKPEFDAAETIIIQGAIAESNKDYNLAARNYVQARSMFIIVTELALEKRRIADEAIHEAELRIAESDEAAYRADLLIRGGE
jgi:hypothetical protein